MLLWLQWSASQDTTALVNSKAQHMRNGNKDQLWYFKENFIWYFLEFIYNNGD